MIKRSRLVTGILMLFTAVLVVWGCASKRAVFQGPDGQQLTWDQMDVQQRKELMRTEVLPRAGVVFKQWRPDRYASVDCTLCHGKGVQTGDFHMPTDHLPRLSGSLFLGPEFAEHPETTQLKLDRLVPEIADALGVKPFSLITRKGFGCYSCHLGPEGPMFGN